MGGEGGTALRRLAIAAAGVSLAVLAAAACALSYPSLHDLAVAAGVRPNLATIYPAAFDALLVIAGCSVLALRRSGLPSRLYAWTCLVVLLAVLAAGSAVHSARLSVPRRPAEIAAAVIPWALLATGLALLLLLLRHARITRDGWVADDEDLGTAPPATGVDAAEPPFAELPVDEPSVVVVPATGGLRLAGRLPAHAAPEPPAVWVPSPLAPSAPSPLAPSPEPGSEPPALRRPHSSPTPPRR